MDRATSFLASSSLRSDAGLGDALDDVLEDELVPEFDDSPWTTTGTKFSVLRNKLFPCLVRCGF